MRTLVSPNGIISSSMLVAKQFKAERVSIIVAINIKYYFFVNSSFIIIVVMSLNLIFFRGTPNKQKCLQKLEGGERQPYKETMKELFTKK